MVSLQPITESNRAAVLALRVAPEQEQFVSGVEDSIAEAAAEPDGRAIQWALCSGGTPVGFVMIADDVGSPDYFPQYLWKLLIDRDHQRQGYGTGGARPGRRLLPPQRGRDRDDHERRPG